MSITNSKKARLKRERAGKLNPQILRGEWTRKPQTQVKPNTKAEQRRTQCRQAGSRDGADLFFGFRTACGSSHETSRTMAGEPVVCELPCRCAAVPTSGNRSSRPQAG
jgi:hypothetical protein